MHRYSATLLRIICFEEKRPKEHDCPGDCEEPVSVDIGEGGCLRLDHVVQPAKRLILRRRQAQASLMKLTCKAVNGSLKPGRRSVIHSCW